MNFEFECMNLSGDRFIVRLRRRIYRSKEGRLNILKADNLLPQQYQKSGRGA